MAFSLTVQQKAYVYGAATFVIGAIATANIPAGTIISVIAGGIVFLAKDIQADTVPASTNPISTTEPTAPTTPPSNITQGVVGTTPVTVYQIQGQTIAVPLNQAAGTIVSVAGVQCTVGYPTTQVIDLEDAGVGEDTVPVGAIYLGNYQGQPQFELNGNYYS